MECENTLFVLIPYLTFDSLIFRKTLDNDSFATFFLFVLFCFVSFCYFGFGGQMFLLLRVNVCEFLLLSFFLYISLFCFGAFETCLIQCSTKNFVTLVCKRFWCWYCCCCSAFLLFSLLVTYFECSYVIHHNGVSFTPDMFGIR